MSSITEQIAQENARYPIEANRWHGGEEEFAVRISLLQYMGLGVSRDDAERAAVDYLDKVRAAINQERAKRGEEAL